MATATATVTIARASHADAKSLVPLTATHDGNFRYSQDTTLQQHPTTTGFGQPGQTQTHSVSEDSSRHDSTSSADNVAITAPQSRPSQPAAIAPTAANLGPCSRQTQMPPRPKPGRKPLPQEDAQDRRRLQNRMAQRSFRDKRAQKVSDLTKDNAAIREQAEQVHRKLSNALEDQRNRATQLALENEKLKAELEAAKKRADDAERKLQMASHSNGVVRSLGFPHATLQNIGTSTSLPPMMANWSGPVGEHARASSGAVATPAVDNNNNNNNNNNTNWAEYETDMTNTWSRRNNNAAQNNAPQNNGTQNNGTQNNDNDSQWLSNSMDVDGENDQCGFCTDEGNCACMQSQKAQAQAQPQPQTLPQPVIQPGGCEACIADPARAARCKAIADQGELSQRPTQTNSNNGQRTDSLVPIPGMVSCSTAVDRLGPNMPSIGDLFPGTFHVYPGTSGSSYDLAEQEVAQVLQSMRRNTASGVDLQKQ
jgi:hypothetical protein